jgi:hypothetical protein
MLTILTNALNKTIKNVGGKEMMTGSVIQAYNEPIWYVSFLLRTGGTILLEVIWRDGGIVGSVLNDFKISESTLGKIVDHFLLQVEATDHPPLYDYVDPANVDYSDMPALET